MAIERRYPWQAYSIGTLLIASALPAYGCWEDAATRYRVSSTLLHAIARTESGLNPHALGWNRNGSRDIGLMQINSWWLPTLARHGIREQDLLEPCTSIHVGAWILAQNIARYGYTWEAVGAYNASSPYLRRAYAARVHKNLGAALTSVGTRAPLSIEPREQPSQAFHP